MIIISFKKVELLKDLRVKFKQQNLREVITWCKYKSRKGRENKWFLFGVFYISDIISETQGKIVKYIFS